LIIVIYVRVNVIVSVFGIREYVRISDGCVRLIVFRLLVSVRGDGFFRGVFCFIRGIICLDWGFWRIINELCLF